MVSEELIKGTVFDIQGFSVHDGPGCRTLIFFKGCSLRCLWCSNPEGILPFPQPLYKTEKCTFDKLCVAECRSGAITIHENRLEFDLLKCGSCLTFDCVTACCSGALKQGGYNISVDRLYAIINRDRQYWGERGGITLTGGEPFAQPGFAHALLKKCYEAYIHTAVETCGNIPWENISVSLPCLDWIFFDLKHMDSTVHKEITGSENNVILANAMKLGKIFAGRLIFRLPLIPGINDDPGHIHEMAAFIRSAGREEINILPVHHLGREKYRLLGQQYYTDEFQYPSPDALIEVQDHFQQNGVTCYIGSQTPF
jgi:pyruvate formate lyase activating enzyme